MKRFVTYLYEYEGGMKTRNAGFIRVDIRGNLVNLEISIRKLRIGDEKGTIYGLVTFDGLQSLELGEMKALGGQGDMRLQLPARNLQGKPVSIDDVVGITIRFGDDCYIASCWEDEYAEAIARGEYRPWEEIEQKRPIVIEEQNGQCDEKEQGIASNVIETVQVVADRKKSNSEHEIAVAQVDDMEEVLLDAANVTQQEQPMSVTPQCSYRKLELTRMNELPMQDRHYSGNAFLIHGFWNYGYVVLKTEMEGDKKTTWLGVPGVYERPEAAMALAFGFPLFEAVPPEVATAPLNEEKCFSQEELRARNFYQNGMKRTTKNQPAGEDLFGCWFVELHM